MSIHATVQLGRIKEIKKKLRHMPRFLERVIQKEAKLTRRMISEGFDKSQDPYGRAWKQTKQPNKILVKTTRLRRSFRVTPLGRKSMMIRTGVFYAKFHQYGTRYIDVRKMIPEPGRPSTKWKRRWVKLLDRELKAYI